MAFAETLREQANDRPEAIALQVASAGEGGASWRSISFGALNTLANRYAQGFSEHGVQRGDRVLFLIRPSIDFYASLYGLLRLGAVPILLDPGMGLKNMLRCIEQIRPRVIVAIPILHAVRTFVRRPFASAEVFVTAGRRWMWGGTTLEACCAESDDPPPSVALEGDSCALIAFTSGSTGPPKGVVFTHGMLATQSRLLGEAYDWEPGQCMVMCFAAFVLFTLAHGMTTVLPALDMSKPATADPASVVDAIHHHRADYAFASPIIWSKVARYCEQKDVRFPTIGHLITTGAPIPIDLHRRLSKVIPEGAELLTPYGASEALPVSTIGSREILTETWEQSRNGAGICVGRPFRGVEVFVIRVTDEPLPTWSDDLLVAPGDVGELAVMGEMVSPEYKDHPEGNAAAKIDRDGKTVHRMGDLGRIDEAGRIWFCGRKAHRLETSAGMIPPVPVENVFNEHPKVFRSALVGLGEPGSQIPVLAVEMEPGETLSPAIKDELRSLAGSTPYENLVKQFLPHPDFPVDARHNSKIKRELVAQWAQREAGGGAE